MNAAVLLAFVLAVGVIAARVLGGLFSWLWRRRNPGGTCLHPFSGWGPLAAAVLPPAGLAVGVAALLPGKPWVWLSGLCACEAYGGVHICPRHPDAVARLLILVTLLALAVLVASGRRVLALLVRMRDLQHITGQARRQGDALMAIDAGARPLAMVAGLLRPRLYVDGTWWSHLSDRERRLIEAHEGAHRAARDPLVFCWLDLTLSLFAPRVRQDVLRSWLLLAERRADRAAVTADGDALFVAEVICRHARACAPAAVGFGGADLAPRVEWLLGLRPELAARPIRSPGVVLAAMALFAAGHALHRSLEVCLMLLP